MSISILNTDSGLGGKTLLNSEDAQNLTGLKSFNRAPNAPFTVQAGSAVVTNLDADKLDGQEGSYYSASAAQAAWPVGSIYIAVLSTNPSTLLGFGTWAAFAAGRVLVGLDAGQTEFDVVEETGGFKTHTLTTAELAVHSHGVTDPGHRHTNRAPLNAGGTLQLGVTSGDAGVPTSLPATDMATNTTGVSINNAGSGTAHNNLQPYVVVYMWKRTA